MRFIKTRSPESPRDSPDISPSLPTKDAICRWKSRDPVKCATRRPVLAGMEELFQSGSIDQNRSSANWPLAKILQRYINHVTRRLVLSRSCLGPGSCWCTGSRKIHFNRYPQNIMRHNWRWARSKSTDKVFEFKRNISRYLVWGI